MYCYGIFTNGKFVGKICKLSICIPLKKVIIAFPIIIKIVGLHFVTPIRQHFPIWCNVSPIKNLFMKIAPNTVVSLTYELYVGEDRETIEIVGEDEPMVFIHGISGLPEGFENHLVGLSAGDTFDFTVDAESGYGEIDEEAIVEMALDMFKIEEDGSIPAGMLEEGNFIPFTNEDGHKMTGRVVEVLENDGVVVLDFNHPLAGKIMHFNGSVLSVREATQSELDHGHVHGEGGVHHH